MRMNALIFVYFSAVSFAIDGLLGQNLLYISSLSALIVLGENIWSINRETPVIDERKEELLTKGMAWSYITATLVTVFMLGTNAVVNAEAVTGVLEFGIWTFVMYISLNLLYQQFGGDGK
ncbi:hypothetical protein LC1Nh_0703 [Candidatus Nanohalobium constans]|uniref:DUF2178 domain-containing protein n=2 Tax=Candidatus Nanohalobium constans TaxID=2565781 RepID=A0A5Q0UG21_9ARCH|nr:hypothetical protein LC1Nh_0703 [Candidatus Nanohalobium constans]